MRILLDECVHAGLRAAFPGHEVRTVRQIGHLSSRDDMLLQVAQRSFDVFVTIDRKLPLQHKIETLNLGVILVRVPNNTIQSYRPLFAALLEAVENVRSGELIQVA